MSEAPDGTRRPGRSAMPATIGGPAAGDLHPRRSCSRMNAVAGTGDQPIGAVGRDAQGQGRAVKIILHMGQGKTGTTALQGSLSRASGMLRDRKVLYPTSGYVFGGHHLLVFLAGCPAPFPRWRLAGVEGPKDPGSVARRAWEETCAAVRRDPPDVLVLSSEELLHKVDARGKSRLAATLAELSPDITPVVYVRHPVDHYRARVQEWVKRNDTPHPPT